MTNKFPPGSKRLILASSSDARRVMLQSAGLTAEIRPSTVDEDALRRSALAEGASARETALLLADTKAAQISVRVPDAIVIGADQLLVCEGQWFDKPSSVVVARAQLKALRNRSHELVTAVVCHQAGQRLWHHVDTPRLLMRDFSDPFLESYLEAEGDQLLFSVGAYRAEGPGVMLFDRIEGDHFSILGLPLLPLLAFLRQNGAIPS